MRKLLILMLLGVLFVPIAHDCQRMMTTAGTDPCGISYPDLLKAHLDRRTAETPDI
jgi:hypothetical protein